MILFGEWAVLNGHPCLGLPVKRSFLLTGTYNKKVHSNTLRLISDKKDLSVNLDKNQAEPIDKFWQWPLEIIFDLIKNNSEKTFNQINFFRNWTLSQGLGSSSAVFLLIHKLFNSKSLDNWPETLSKFLKLQRSGSGMDLAIQYHNSPIIFENKQVQKTKLAIPEELMIFHTNEKFISSQKIKETALSQHFCQKISESTQSFIKTRDWEKAIKEHQSHLEELNVQTPIVKKVCDELFKKNLISCFKTTGAGGGDSVLILAKGTQRRDEIQSIINKNKAWIDKEKLI